MRAYYDAFSGNPDIFPFAAQLYFLAEHWFTRSSQQGQFIDDSFARAAEDVQRNSRYRSSLDSLFPPLLFPNASRLGAFGTLHLQDHIRPVYMEHLVRGIETGMQMGMSCADASGETIRKLRNEHELFLAESVPYAIQRLRAMDILAGPISHEHLIQARAQSMRFLATREILIGYVIRGMLPGSELQRLLHGFQ